MTDFEQIYKDYFRDVFLYVRRLSGGDERLAEDITSEAFFRALHDEFVKEKPLVQVLIDRSFLSEELKK